MAKFIEWWNGKKSNIGAVCLWLTANLPGLFLQLGLGVDASWDESLFTVLNWVGTILLPVGLAHKAKKAWDAAKDTAVPGS